VPRLLNYIVAIYLIITGLLGLFPHLRESAEARAPHPAYNRRPSTLPLGLPRPVQASQPGPAA
jgi:hypothetical protein